MRPTATMITLALTAAIAVSGCTRMKNVQGYIADDQLIAAIQPGVDNKASVAKTLGRPSIASQWDDQQWFYLNRETRQFAFLKPKPAKQLLLIVNFDKTGNVSSVERRGMEQVATISPEGDKTPTLGRETGILQDLFGNIGRVGAPMGGGPGGGTNP